MTEFANARQTMVDCQIRPNEVTSPAVLAAFLAVPREDFVPQEQRALAYSDRTTAFDNGAVMLSPMVQGKLVQLAQVAAGNQVLVVGNATGYIAAILTHMGATPRQVAPEAAQRGTERAFDAIIIEGAVETGLDGVLEQLADGGRLVVIEAIGASSAVVYTRSGSAFSRRAAFHAAAPVLAGYARKAEFVF